MSYLGKCSLFSSWINYWLVEGLKHGPLNSSKGSNTTDPCKLESSKICDDLGARAANELAFNSWEWMQIFPIEQWRDQICSELSKLSPCKAGYLQSLAKKIGVFKRSEAARMHLEILSLEYFFQFFCQTFPSRFVAFIQAKSADCVSRRRKQIYFCRF